MVPWKALSLSRPWPYAILHLGKPIENRSRKDGRMPYICKHRGPLLLHAAKSWDKTAADWMVECGLLPSTSRLASDPAVGTMFGSHSAAARAYGKSARNRLHPAGGIVGRCRAVGHIAPDGGCWTDPQQRIAAEGFPKSPADLGLRPSDMIWWMSGYGLILADVEPLPFVPCRGHLGLWSVPHDIVEELGLAA